MNRTIIKNYAPKARREFIAAVTAKAGMLGITREHIAEAKETGDYLIVNGRPLPVKIAPHRQALLAEIERKGFDEVIEEAQPDGLAARFHAAGDAAVLRAGRAQARRVVVRHGDARSRQFQRQAQQHGHVHHGALRAALRETAGLHHPVRPVEQGHPQLLMRQVDEQRLEQAEEVAAVADARPLRHFMRLAAVAQFECRLDGDGLRLANALEAAAQFADAEPRQFVEVVLAFAQDTAAQLHGGFVRVARPDEDSQQLGIREGRRAVALHLLAGAVVFRPLADGEAAGLFHQ